MDYNFYWKYTERPKRIIRAYINRLLGWNNAILIQREVNKHRNELVIDSPNRIVKLLGWTDQYEDDYFWVIDTSRKIELHSCVGGFVWIKGKLNGFDYYQMLEVWELNSAPLSDVLEGVKAKGIILK